MKIFYKFLLPALLLPAFCLAQKNYKSGYVVTLQGDTLKGFIDYREWVNTPSEIKFKADAATGQIQTFSVDNAAAFTVTGLETYQRFTVNVSMNSISAVQPIFGNDTAANSKTVFLRVLIRGDKVNLYSYSDDAKVRYYYAEKNSTPAEFIYFLIKNDDGTITPNKRYRPQLTYLALKFNANKPSVMQAIAKAEYNEFDLVNIIKQINGKISVESTSNGNSGSQFFIGGGINYAHIKFGGLKFANSGTTDSQTPMPYLNAGFNYFINNTTRKFFVTVDLSLIAENHKFHNTSSGNDGNTTIVITDASLDFSQYSAVINPQIGYNFYSTSALKVFGSVGYAIDLSAYSDYSYKETYSVTTSQLVAHKYPELQKFWFAPTLKLGITLNQKIDIYAARMLSTGITDHTGYSASLSRYQLGMHYVLGK